MDSFTIRVADMNFSLSCMFGSTKEYFRDYLTSQPADSECILSEQVLSLEQQFLNEEADAEGIRRRVFTMPFLERSSIMRRTAQQLLSRDVILLHGSTVTVDGRGYLFAADCGVGKSTHTRLWREVFGAEAVMLNDDRAFLKREGDQILAYGSPWMGKHGIGTNISVPLAGICILNRGKENRIMPLSADEALPILKKQVFLPFPGDQQRVEALGQQLLACVPLWNMQCTKSPEAALTAYRVMSAK